MTTGQRQIKSKYTSDMWMILKFVTAITKVKTIWKHGTAKTILTTVRKLLWASFIHWEVYKLKPSLNNEQQCKKNKQFSDSPIFSILSLQRFSLIAACIMLASSLASPKLASCNFNLNVSKECPKIKIYKIEQNKKQIQSTTSIPTERYDNSICKMIPRGSSPYWAGLTWLYTKQQHLYVFTDL